MIEINYKKKEIILILYAIKFCVFDDYCAVIAAKWQLSTLSHFFSKSERDIHESAQVSHSFFSTK